MALCYPARILALEGALLAARAQDAERIADHKKWLREADDNARELAVKVAALEREKEALRLALEEAIAESHAGHIDQSLAGPWRSIAECEESVCVRGRAALTAREA